LRRFSLLAPFSCLPRNKWFRMDPSDTSGMPPTVEEEPAVDSELPCVVIDGRSNGAPGWCNNLPELTCASRFVDNLHGVRRPCVWLDVGCRMSSAVACADASSSFHAVPLIGVVLLLAVSAGFVLLKSPLSQKLFPHKKRRGATPSPARRSDADDDDEAGGLLHADEPACSAGITLATATAMSAEAAREAAVACAAAHALLATPTPTTGELDRTLPATAEEATATSTPALAPARTPPVQEQALQEASAEREIAAGRDGSGGGGVAVDSCKTVDGSRDDLNLPSLSMSKARAAFDEGDLPELTMRFCRPAADSVAQLPQADAEEEDGFLPRSAARSEYMASTSALALTLD